MTWLSSWRDQCFVVSSPLTVDDARRRLRDGLTTRGPAFAVGLASITESRVVRGQVRQESVRLVAMRPGVRNSWRPVLRGRLQATDIGCQLACRLGWDPFVRVFTACWLGAVLLGFVHGVVTTVGRAWTGDFATLRDSATLIGGTLGSALFIVGLTTLARRLSRGDVAHLRTWLAERLQSPD